MITDASSLREGEMEKQAVFKMPGWAGYSETPCLVIGEIPKRYRVKLVKRCRLPGRMRWGFEGQILLMPKRAVRVDQ